MKKHKLFIADPLILAMLLSVVTILLSWLYGPVTGNGFAGLLDIFAYWEQGFWDLLAFSMQMVLILFLGYMLALSPLFERLSNGLSVFASKPIAALLFVVFSALLLGFINWGLALVFGAILVRKIGEKAASSGKKVNYPLLGASAYVCMMVWHGGLSGSAPLAVADTSHFLTNQIGTISLTDTVFSKTNLWAALLLFVFIPPTVLLLNRKGAAAIPTIQQTVPQSDLAKFSLSKYRFPGLLSLFGMLLLLAIVFNKIAAERWSNLGLNDVNLILLALVFIFSGGMASFQQSAAKAVVSTVGIIIQFPLYAGIMGILNYSGILKVFTVWFSEISSPEMFPLVTMLSAGLVNFFVPSGGGQWAVQGPVIMEAARLLEVSYAKSLLALAYGDQLTNMLQPFWALPLLGITGLKAIEIVRYTIVFMGVGSLIFALVLMFF